MLSTLSNRRHTTAALLPVPGLAFGAYPEGSGSLASGCTKFIHAADRMFEQIVSPDRSRYTRFIAGVHARAGPIQMLSPEQFSAKAMDLRARLSAAGLNETLVTESFALVREATSRELRLSHYDNQLMAARIMLDNRLAEMEAGEGKTLALALAAATAALAGIPVHVITANDYLAARDANALRSVYGCLGLTAGTVTAAASPEQRRAAYACDVTYCTSKELVFDYLRDRLILGSIRSDIQLRSARLVHTKADHLLLRGLCMALVDEADSVLIDEASMPLIISQSRVNRDQGKAYRRLLTLARSLSPDIDFRVHRTERRIELTGQGRQKIVAAPLLESIWLDRRFREECVDLALSALNFYERDREYLVRNGRVHIIDATTGRVAPGRVWSRGLHQMIEIKEGCEPSGEQETIAQITFQRFFLRYLRLAGMSGTLRESQAELASVYGLAVVRVPLRKPNRRVRLRMRVYTTAEATWSAVVERVRELREAGRPVLLGTDSVANSETLSAQLEAAGLPHQVLNARHDSAEAKIVAQAGQPGQVTVTTNMAGRGTDIRLACGVAERGGLHVISCQHNSARRIDRQLYGRSARQGDPGSAEKIVCLHNSLASGFFPSWIPSGLTRCASRSEPLPRWLGWAMTAIPQRLQEWKQRAHRTRMLKRDALLDRRLSLGGPGE